MAALRFTRSAEVDLSDIARYTLERWGGDQTIRHLDDLETGCRQLADAPELGRACDHIRPGLRRMERGRHVILYRPDSGGSLVCRVLHQRMLPDAQIDA